MKSPNTIDSAPESLQLIEAWLIRHGYVANTRWVAANSRWHGPAVPNTITGWLLTWSLRTTKGWVECGSLLVAAGVAHSPTTTLFTSESAGSRASDASTRVASTPEKHGLKSQPQVRAKRSGGGGGKLVR